MAASDGFPLYYRRIVPANSRAAVIFLHGMSEHSGMYLHVIQGLGAAGFTVLAPDQRGRGQSVGGRWRRGDLRSVARILADIGELRERHRAELDGLPVFMVAVSMGAIMAQSYALEHQGSLAGMVLVGPPFGVPAAASGMRKAAIGLMAALAPRLPMRPAPAISDISRERNVQWELECDPYCYHGPLRARAARELMRALARIERRIGELSLPLLIQYGSQDRIVSLRETQGVQKGWGGADTALTVMDGLYHDVLNEPERQAALDGITSWMDARVK